MHMMQTNARLTAAGTLAMLFASVAGPEARADEGMWTIEDFPAEAVEERYGVQVDRAFLERLRLATTRLEGGCTGSFASPGGLVLTNHHCVQRCIAQLSSEAEDVAATGFLAQRLEDERRCPTDQLSVLVAVEDVSDAVAAAVADQTGEDANRIRKATLTELENACTEAAGEGHSCESVALYAGGQHFLYTYRRYEDVRLVFAPERSIAAFGGDPDNFNYPRWCLDMALLRVYEDGAPVESPAYLPWKRAGAKAGEAVFVSGHPGSTQRQLTVAELLFLRNEILPDWLLRYAELRGRLIQYAHGSDEARRQALARLARIENGIKVRRNELAALLDEQVLARKREEERALRRALADDEALEARYGGAWEAIEEALAKYERFYLRYTYIEERAGFAGDLYRFARELVRAAEERTKPEPRRLRAYTSSNLGKIRQRVLAPQPVHRELETMLLTYSLEKLRERLGPDDPFVQLVLGGRSPAQLAARVIGGTRLDDPEVRAALWEGGLGAIEASDDPLIRLARAVDPEARQLRRRYDDEVEAPVKTAGEQIAAARFAVLGTGVYPDATFTLRITYGAVAGWTEDGEEIAPFTTLGGLYPRVTGAPPFALPPSWREPPLPESTRFNFVATADITGGNSGSPVVDASGALVGLAFDGNVHSIAGAFYFDETLNRAIAVHPAVMLGALEKVYGATRLVGEIEVQ